MASPSKDPLPPLDLILYQSSRSRYSASSLADLAEIHPEMVLCYWKLGLLRAEGEGKQDPLFDDDALFLVKRLEELRRDYHLSLRALRLLAQTLYAEEG